ncbi:hypothetical protein TAMA11512_01230 [Selenomonas sp. TAMA-11512]|uniref:ABC transporter ATP-binding protein n=1 Tax=Selenomonas sp. TAMA-11512 TaxID=3095337 RepID=UPI00308A5129|nr:hypothetical protein TAMA11512_01230 [Selenomonas sp. TAMA-11512]
MSLRFEAKDLHVLCGSREILKGISLALPAGEALAVVGESGSGKSTLLRTILGDLPSDESVAGGDLLYEGTSLLSMRREERRALAGHDIAIMFQQPGRFLNPIRTIEKQFRDFLTAHGMRARDTHDFAAEALRKAGFEDPERILSSYVFRLSGGQRQRVALAMLLSFAPRLILLDEPTAALDVVAVRELLDTMRGELARGASILLVTHHIHAASYLADQFLVLQKGRTVEAGRSRDILKHPQHPYTQALLDAALQVR